MSLVQTHKGRRARRLKGRPEWQDVVPPEKELRDAYAIAARHVDRFGRAFRDAARGLFSDDVLGALRGKLRDGSIEGALAAIPWFRPGDEKADAVWAALRTKLEAAYADVVRESGQTEYRRLKLPLDFEIQKRKVPTVPVNPYSLQWIRQQAGKLIAEISNSQRETVREVILDGFSRGLRAEAVLGEIKQTVGLLARERQAVARRRALHAEVGLPPQRVEALGAKYANELLAKRAERIARTETIAAQAQGLHDAWRVAQEAGALPRDVVRIWVAPPPSPSPNRPCPICVELDGKTAAIGEPFESSLVGPTMSPPSHPSCRCTTRLARRSRGGA